MSSRSYHALASAVGRRCGGFICLCRGGRHCTTHPQEPGAGGGGGGRVVRGGAAAPKKPPASKASSSPKSARVLHANPRSTAPASKPGATPRPAPSSTHVPTTAMMSPSPSMALPRRPHPVRRPKPHDHRLPQWPLVNAVPIHATNAKGRSRQTFLIRRRRSQLALTPPLGWTLEPATAAPSPSSRSGPAYVMVQIRPSPITASSTLTSMMAGSPSRRQTAAAAARPPAPPPHQTNFPLPHPLPPPPSPPTAPHPRQHHQVPQHEGPGRLHPTPRASSSAIYCRTPVPLPARASSSWQHEEHALPHLGFLG